MEEKSLWKQERLFAVFPRNKTSKALVRKCHPQADLHYMILA